MDDETQGPSQGEKITNLAAISLGLNVGKQLTAGDFGGKKKMKIKNGGRHLAAAHNRHESLQFLAARCFRRRCRSASVGTRREVGHLPLGKLVHFSCFHLPGRSSFVSPCCHSLNFSLFFGELFPSHSNE